MKKPTKEQVKQEAIDLIIAEFKKSGAEFTCLASFNAVRDYARYLAHTIANTHGFVYSKSMYFPQINSGDNLMWNAADKYCKLFLEGKV